MITPSSCHLEITINGKAVWFVGPQTVSDLISAQGLAGKRIAVERNGEIVPKSQHASTAIVAGDNLEIVVAVGGG
ncbi:sulfur carrier protein ThiS [Sulfuritalea sp.]|jgi:sulfur carrier protein|uniref:sulfur carrier protein ThiS n=1 Tax=Sulfuritalea sp. TaxID=2480090 RepID=UPI001ACC7AFA|nr:sulfur carrier protein ThiS [Sulfuritalea sp.]MBN8473901.1 sulfur carrier protein ThiS [Sulfuritalea sp.]